MTNPTDSKSRVNARLDAEITRKLHELMRLEGKSVTEVIKDSIAHYYAAVYRASASPRELLEKSGFIGCASGEETLSANYKRQRSSNAG